MLTNDSLKDQQREYNGSTILILFALSAQIEAFSKKMDNLNALAMQVQAITCNLCGRGHANTNCQVGNSFFHSSDQANYVGNFQRPQNGKV